MTNRSVSFMKIFIAVICISPLLVLLFLSFSRNWPFPGILPRKFSLSNWTYAFSSESGIRESLATTLCLSLSVAALSTVAGFFSSKFIATHPSKKILLFLAYLPFVLSPVILAVCLRFYFIRMDLAGTFCGVLLAHLIIAFPYSVIYFIGFWNRRIADYEIVVQTLGGSARDAFYKVILPSARPTLMVCFFQCFLIAWFEYGLTSVIGFGKVQTLTVKVYQYVTEANLFYAALSCCLLVIPPVLLLWINKRIIFRLVK
jgi:putative spermidine/putrescine transport system permease protein